MRNKALFAAVAILSCSFALGQAQYKVLHTFEGSPTDGANPIGSLVFDGNGNLYGTTKSGGMSAYCQCGIVFKLSPDSNDGWVETVLYTFCTNDSNGLCLDGAIPRAGLVFDAVGNIYGTTYSGGGTCPYTTEGCGTVFELSPPSSPAGVWTETVLHSFCADYSNGTCLDGAWPTSQLILDASGNLYGTTSSGGRGGTGGFAGGTVFELSPGADAWTETVLHDFCSKGGRSCPDGASPASGVTFDKAGNLYGTTEVGGYPDPQSPGGGTVYELSPGSNGWTETLLYAARPPFHYGANPVAKITFDPQGNLYSTASDGGPGGLNGAGSVFKLGANGFDQTLLFNGSDGWGPTAEVLIDHGTLYGTTATGGANPNGGTIFQIVAPTKEILLYSFCSQPNCADGTSPEAGLIPDKSGNLYGTAAGGGATNSGVVFEITPPALQ
jgi:uncharacterized repeat protein (TIGR03803 family)